jgi:hypothetical protein
VGAPLRAAIALKANRHAQDRDGGAFSESNGFHEAMFRVSGIMHAQAIGCFAGARRPEQELQGSRW